MKQYVAVVTKGDFTSCRQMGDWACFVDKTKKTAVERAMKARTRWEANGTTGPYKIFVGVLGEEVVVPTAYKLEPISEEV